MPQTWGGHISMRAGLLLLDPIQAENHEDDLVLEADKFLRMAKEKRNLDSLIKCNLKGDKIEAST